MAPASPISDSEVSVSMSYELRYRGYRREGKTESVIEEVKRGSRRGGTVLKGCRTGKALLLPSPHSLFPPPPSLPPCSDLLPVVAPSTNLKPELNAPLVSAPPPNHKNSTRSLTPFFSKPTTTIQLSAFPPSSAYLANMSRFCPYFLRGL